MDLLRIIRSFEEFLFEAATWLFLYPRTFWRVLRRPAALADYVEVEMSEEISEQFTDIVSPPLFLIMSILFAHLLELAFHMRVPATSEIGRQISESSQALLLFRSVAFSLFPLVMSAGMLRRQGSPIDRVTLRRPFYLQCFYVAPFAVVISSAIILGRLPYPGALPAALAIGLAVSIWYVMVEAGWLRSRLGVGWPRAVGVAVILFASAVLLAFALGFAILMPSVDFSLGLG